MADRRHHVVVYKRADQERGLRPQFYFGEHKKENGIVGQRREFIISHKNTNIFNTTIGATKPIRYEKDQRIDMDDPDANFKLTLILRGCPEMSKLRDIGDQDQKDLRIQFLEGQNKALGKSIQEFLDLLTTDDLYKLPANTLGDISRITDTLKKLQVQMTQNIEQPITQTEVVQQ